MLICDWDLWGLICSAAEWEVHLTLNGEEPFIEFEEPCNLPVIVTAKGAVRTFLMLSIQRLTSIVHRLRLNTIITTKT